MAKRKKSSVKTWVWRVCLTLGLLIGLAMVFNEQIKLFFVDRMSQSTMQTVTQKSVKANEKKKATYDFDAVSALDLTTVSKAMTDASKDAIGMLAVPSVKIYLPVLQGLSNTHMATGAGTMKPGQKMGEGNYALAGHSIMKRTGPLMSPLDYTKVGDMVYLTDMTHVYTYKITEKKTIDMSHVEVVDDVPGKKLVTLITCEALTNSNADRVYVRGELQKVEAATDKTIKIFEKK
ncbi:class A sortase [Lacticaseibacillus absianus]|uniref:class A sortase n=1 Tax=Lacticaseibacillus absianus TaxID=2729623 RepID=UPI0015CEB41F|nr:class A sortase [Lacticaseibacillus absianus]